MVLGGALGPGLGGRDAAAFCVAGVALGDIHPGTFSPLHRHRACDLRAGRGCLHSSPVGIVHKLS